MLNPAWILSFGVRAIPLAEVLIVALLVVLAVVFGRLSHEPAADVRERVLFRGPVALYAGLGVAGDRAGHRGHRSLGGAPR